MQQDKGYRHDIASVSYPESRWAAHASLRGRSAQALDTETRGAAEMDEREKYVVG